MQFNSIQFNQFKLSLGVLWSPEPEPPRASIKVNKAKKKVHALRMLRPPNMSSPEVYVWDEAVCVLRVELVLRGGLAPQTFGFVSCNFLQCHD